MPNNAIKRAGIDITQTNVKNDNGLTVNENLRELVILECSQSEADNKTNISLQGE